MQRFAGHLRVGFHDFGAEELIIIIKAKDDYLMIYCEAFWRPTNVPLKLCYPKRIILQESQTR